MWTLKKAKRDFKSNNPECKNCAFSKSKEFFDPDPYYPIHGITITCKVMSTIVENNQAIKCKYFTVK